jgi:hypothetical protein
LRESRGRSRDGVSTGADVSAASGKFARDGLGACAAALGC